MSEIAMEIKGEIENLILSWQQNNLVINGISERFLYLILVSSQLNQIQTLM